MNIADFLSHLDSPRRTPSGFIALCPAHDDRSPSLSISGGDDGRILIKCWAACTPEEIVESMGLRLSDLFPEKQTLESRVRFRRMQSLKRKKSRIHKIDLGLQGVFREAESTLSAAKGIDISLWSEDELDRAMMAVCEAYEVLRIENDELQAREYS